MKESKQLAEAKALMRSRPDITGVFEGYKYTGGRKTDELSILIGVKEKKPIADLDASVVLPEYVGELRTDVSVMDPAAQEYTQRLRPCPAGLSVGHRDITAGTIGLAVKQGDSDEWLALTNAHVGGPHYDGALIGDPWYQPGPHDGDTPLVNRWGELHEYVAINLPEEGPAPWWLQWIWDLIEEYLGSRELPQDINLVDAALGRPYEGMFLPEQFTLGTVRGLRDPVLGEEVAKDGRTTETTHGIVEGLNGLIRVSGYADATVEFDQQTLIRGVDGAEFSAGGDSGSAIIASSDKTWVGLLFAGGQGDTYANMSTNVSDLFGGLRVV